ARLGWTGMRRGRRGPDDGTRGDRRRAGAGIGLNTDGLAGRRVVVSAGPTFEDLDPVRFLGNRSSGKMGFAIAAAAAARGARTTLVAGPVALGTPEGAQRADVRSAAQMHSAAMAAPPADILIRPAPEADLTPP